MDFQRLFLENKQLIDRLVTATCRRNRLTKEEAEDFASEVDAKLIADDYAVLRAFCGKSTLGGYLNAVIQRAYQDHRNHLWGKWRPSAEARRLGPLAVRLDTMLHRDRMTLDEALATVPPEHRDEARRLAAKLPARTRRRMEDVDQLDQVRSGDLSPEEQLLERERADAAEGLHRGLAEALDTLPPEDRLLIQLRMEEGAKIVHVARAFGVDRRQMYGRWHHVKLQLRKALEEKGYDARQVAWLLESSSSQEPVEAMSGPSSMRG